MSKKRRREREINHRATVNPGGKYYTKSQLQHKAIAEHLWKRSL